MSERRIFGLDLLRAVAIGRVLADHSHLFFAAALPAWLMHLVTLGDVGVDLFFVLSGYLIGGILLRDLAGGASPPVLLRFWSRRWWRTLPNYYFWFAVSIGVSFWFQGHRNPVKPYLVFAQAFAWEPPWPFNESWSLCVEEWFYLLFPGLTVLLAVAMPCRRAYLMAAAVVALSSFAARSEKKKRVTEEKGQESILTFDS